MQHPARPRLRRPHRRRAPRDRDHRRRPRRHPQPDPAREGHQVPARRPAARRGPRHRRPARRQPHPARCSPPTSATCSSSPPTAPRSRSSSARLYEQRRVAEALQRRLLPGELARRARASRRRPATCRPRGGSLGGDWYDVFPLAGGRVGVAVGDVVGHGVEAAAVMAQLRTAVRAYAVDGHPPGAVVERVNSLMLQPRPAGHDDAGLPRDRPGGGDARARQRRAPAARWSIEPVRRRPTTCGRRAGSRSAPPTAAIYAAETLPAPDRLDRPALHRRARRAPRRSRSTSASSGCARWPTAPTTSRRCASRSSSELVPEAPGDDVAFIAARVPPLADHLATRWRATPDSLAPIRYLLRRWLLDARRDASDEAFDIIVATPGGVRERDRARLRPRPRASSSSTAAYDGRPRHDHGHRPRPLAAAARRATAAAACRSCATLMDDRRRQPDRRDGTAVTLVRTLAERRHEPARPGRRGAPRRASRSRASSGEIDASNVALARGAAARAAHATAATALVVDLTGDDLPRQRRDRAAVRARRRRSRQHQQQLRLVVAEGSPIARMARLTGLTDAVPTHPTLEAALAEP